MSRLWKPLPTHLPGWRQYAPPIPKPMSEQTKRRLKNLRKYRARRIGVNQGISRRPEATAGVP